MTIAVTLTPIRYSPGQQKPPTLFVATRLVEVSVVADDKKGHPVSDLTQDDFHLFDKGHEQKIARFEFVSSSSMIAAPLNLLPNVYTNLPGQPSSIPNSVTIILLDRLNTSFLDQSWARPQIVKYLGHIQPRDRVALYTLGPGLNVLHDFTSDASSLIAALHSLQSTRSPQIEQAAVPDPEKNPALQDLRQAAENNPTSLRTQQLINELTAFLTDANNQDIGANLDDRVRKTLGAFSSIAQHVAGFPGRKNLLWVSGAFPIQFDADIGKLPGHQNRDYGESIERTTQLLSSANVAVYPVDARGLIPQDLATSAPMISSRRDAVIPALPPSLDPNDLAVIEEIAHNTGGRAFFNTNDIENSIARAVDDARTSYILGYYPDNAQWNGEFHEIKVKVDRPGVRVRARSGYLATRSAHMTEKDQNTMLLQIASSPLESTGLALFAKLDPRSSSGSRDSVDAFLNVDPRGLTLNFADGHWTGHAVAAFIPLDARGLPLGNGIVEQTVDMNLSPQTYRRLMQSALKLQKRLTLEPKAVQLCIVAIDESTGRAGSVHIPVVRNSQTQQSQ